MPIIRRKYRTYGAPGISNSIYMSVWYVGRPSCITEESNKHIKKICAPSYFYVQDYTRMQVNTTYMTLYTRWFKYDRDICGLFIQKSVPVIFEPHFVVCKGTAVAQWLRCCATNRKVAGSISDGVIGIFH